MQTTEELLEEIKVLNSVNDANQKKIKQLTEELNEDKISRQYADESLFMTLMDIKDTCESIINMTFQPQSCTWQLAHQGKVQLAEQIVATIKEVIPEEE